MFCRQCGQKDLNGGNFCANCGDGLSLSTATGAIQAQAMPAPSQAQTDSADQALASFVGDKYHDYYHAKWLNGKPESDGYKKGLGVYSFNMAGFFLSVFWLCYRKMYGVAFMLVITLPALDIIMMYMKGFEGYSATGGLLYSLIWLFVTGFLGNHIYYKHASKKVKKISGSGEDASLLRERLAKAGGTSLSGAIVFGTLAILTILMMYLLFAPSWY